MTGGHPGLAAVFYLLGGFHGTPNLLLVFAVPAAPALVAVLRAPRLVACHASRAAYDAPGAPLFLALPYVALLALHGQVDHVVARLASVCVLVGGRSGGEGYHFRPYFAPPLLSR